MKFPRLILYVYRRKFVCNMLANNKQNKNETKISGTFRFLQGMYM